MLRDFMRDVVRSQREEAGYDAWFQRKVEAGLAAAKAGQVTSGDEVEATFAKRRADARRKAGESDR